MAFGMGKAASCVGSNHPSEQIMIATIARTLVRSLPLSRIVSIAAVVLGLGVLMPTSASAVSSNVRNACMGDYFNFCAGMEVGSQELRRCFNKNGAKLSSPCVAALVSAGEVSKAEVDRRAGKSKVASKKSRSATRMASRSQCVQGPARPGAAASSTCRSVASRGGKAKRQYATLR
jgi:hypothetical protein